MTKQQILIVLLAVAIFVLLVSQIVNPSRCRNTTAVRLPNGAMTPVCTP